MKAHKNRNCIKKEEAAAVNDGNGCRNGIVATDNQQQQLVNSSSQSNQKCTQAYKLFSEGKKPVQVAIELGFREKQVDKFFREFWKLKNLNELYVLYPQIEHCIPSFLKLQKALKKRGLNPNNVEWFSDAIETGAIKIPEIQKQYTKIIEELEVIDYKKTMAKYELQNINNQISILNRDIHNKKNEIAYLHFEVQELEGYLQAKR